MADLNRLPAPPIPRPLAGAFYGEGGITARWLATLAKRHEIATLAEGLGAASNARGSIE